MHPDADAFLDAIFDSPDDDTPRLVYADWLQEHGQEAHAQFIRLQCAAAREKFWSDEANRLWEEIGRVWARLDEEWWPATRDVWDFPGLVPYYDITRQPFGAWAERRGWVTRNLDAVHFHRGFLRESVPLTSGQIVDYGGSCWPWLPLPGVALRPDGREHELLSAPRVGRIRALRLTRWEDHHYAISFVAAPELANLERLDLSELLLVPNDMDSLLEPGLFPKLKEVRLRVQAGDSRLHQRLQQRTEKRFEKVVWLGNP